MVSKTSHLDPTADEAQFAHAIPTTTDLGAGDGIIGAITADHAADEFAIIQAAKAASEPGFLIHRLVA